MDWKDSLVEESWEEGKVILLLPCSYRHRVVITCFEKGRQTAQFLNGNRNYSAHIELMGGDGHWSPEGSNIVPVLPDGRILMVVEQRPAHYRWGERPPTIQLSGRVVDLRSYGPYSSLEFPGGSFNPGESFRLGSLRELLEETGVEEQGAELFTRRVINQSGADMMKRLYVGVIFLQGVRYDDYTPGDGGLHILALSPEVVQNNFYLGVINSGQAAVMPWAFYKEVREVLQYPEKMMRLQKLGYLTREQVKINK